jgi:hypothetical protein
MKISMRFPSSFSSEGTTEISQLRSGWCLARIIFQVLKGRRMFSTVPSGRIFLRTVFQPLRSWLISGCRFATPFALTTLVLFLAVGATAQTNTLSNAEIQGRKLAQQLCDARPAEDLTNFALIAIRNANGTTNIPIKIETIVTVTNWLNVYEYQSLWPNVYEHRTNEVTEQFIIEHDGTNANQYITTASDGRGRGMGRFTPDEILAFRMSLVNSDFGFCDLGLEFFHWPAQKVLPKTTNLKRGRDYTLLESTNPNPPTNGYSRVLSWIDKESGGILEAEAYDAAGKLLKVFEPKSFKKVNGQWELQEMEIDNVQTGSRTRLEFDLKKQ